MTTRNSDSIAYLNNRGGRAHTMPCMIVANYERMRNGTGRRGRGNCPDLSEYTFGEVMQRIEARRAFECNACKRLREAEAKRFHTADGTKATPIEGDDLKWLVRRSPRRWWVIELHNRETQISEINLNDMGFGRPWGIVAEASRVLAEDIPADMPNHPGAGWFYQYGDSANERPYRRMADAIAGLLLALEMRRTELAEMHAKRQARTAAVASATEAAAEPIRCRTHPSVTTDGRHGASLVIPACESGADYGVWDDNDGGFITSFDCAVEAAGYAAELLDEDPDQVIEIKRRCHDHPDQPHDGCAECFSEDDEQPADDEPEYDDGF